MSHSSSYDVRVQDFLAALTDEHLGSRRKPDLWELAVRYDIPAAEAKDLAALVTSLDAALQDVAPDAHFKQHLRDELMGYEEAVSVIARFGNLPLRLQIAAIAALVAAFALLGRKRVAAQLRQLMPAIRESHADGGKVELINS